MRALGPLRIQLINDDCVGNECSDIESEQTRRVRREASRAADGARGREVSTSKELTFAVLTEWQSLMKRPPERCALESAEQR